MRFASRSPHAHARDALFNGDGARRRDVRPDTAADDSAAAAGSDVRTAARDAPDVYRSDAAVQEASGAGGRERARQRSEEHTSELQSLAYLVCRLLLEKK